jgi:hypothetical protein
MGRPKRGGRVLTIESEDDDSVLHQYARRQAALICVPRASMARRAPGGPRQRLSPALTPGQRRRRRRLEDVKKVLTGKVATGKVATCCNLQ